MNRLLKIEKPSRFVAVAESVLVTLIWASSFVLVKIGLDYMGPLTMAGLRYFLAFLLLLPFMTRNRNITRSMPSRLWIRLFFIGLSAYTIGNGALFWGLKYVPATTGSFLFSLIPLPILFASVLWLKEIPTPLQLAGIVVSLVGSVLFFAPGFSAGESLGIGIVVVGLISFAGFAILGREVARDRQVDTLSLTAIPLAFGGGILLLVAFPMEGLPRFPTMAWGIVLWLAVINTAFAYMLYYHSLQVLTAVEMNVMLNLAPLVTAVLAWFLLSERLGMIQIIGMITAIIGVVLVQWRRRGSNADSSDSADAEP
ncbi:MAG: DMT family transporter [Candidatus Bipolaricaulia bacterium]